jgi:SAM-dependent methyltransferase
MNGQRPGEFQSSSMPEYGGKQELLDSEVGLPKYNSAIVSKFVRNLGLFKNGIEVLEFGSGTGTLAEIMHNDYGIKVDCVEVDPHLCEMVRKKGLKCERFLEKLQEKYDVIYTSNVLGHIQNDLEAIISIKKVMKNNSLLGIYVPAHQFLFSEMDEKIGHFRRYSKEELIEKVETAGFEVVLVRYDDVIGVMASFLVKLVGYKNSSRLGSPLSFKIYDNLIWPLSSILDNFGLNRVTGKNIFMVAKPKDIDNEENRINRQDF